MELIPAIDLRDGRCVRLLKGDFAHETISLSGVFLQAGAREAELSGARLADLTRARPTTRRTFTRADRVTAFVESYQGQSHEALPGYVTTEIFNDTDQRVYQQEVRVVPEASDRRTASLAVELPIDELAPGQYLLTMQMRQGNASARRDVRFQVQ